MFSLSILEPKKSAAPVMKENNRAMEVDTVIIRNMVVVMDTALLVGMDILMEVIFLFSFVIEKSSMHIMCNKTNFHDFPN